tara:strand:+ start:220 stop:405 length:186 start_codon:yes stop_codon:yes gene_type:complete
VTLSKASSLSTKNTDKIKKLKTFSKIKKLKIKSSKPEYLKKKYDVIIPQMLGISLKKKVNF